MGDRRRSEIIAVCGKGGVGKTAITAMMTKLLVGRGDLKILAIDADPAVGLASALGVEAKKTINDIRDDLIDTVKEGKRGDKYEMAAMLDYEVFKALEEGSNFAFLAIGRPESVGCYCQVNSLLKEVIESLSKSFDVVLIDGEAGIEQINRRVMRSVDDLLLISDTSAKGINVVSSIKRLVENEKAVECERMGLVINRVRNKEEVDEIVANNSLNLLEWIPEDDMVREYDFNGKPIIDLPDTSPSIIAARRILKTLGMLA